MKKDEKSGIPKFCSTCGNKLNEGICYYTFYELDNSILKTEHICQECREKLLKMESEINQQTGWKCPQCGNIYSPTVKECELCNKSNKNISQIEIIWESYLS